MKKTPKMLEVEKRIEERIKNYLKREYVKSKRTVPDIAKELEISSAAIYRWMKEHGILVRSKPEARKLVSESEGIKRLSKTELERLYLIENLTTTEIAKLGNVTPSAVIQWMNKYGIERRDNFEAQTRGKVKKPKNQELRRMYHDDYLSIRDIAGKYDVGETSVTRWLDEAGIERREPELTRRLRKGVKLPSKEKLLEEYERGSSISKLAENYSVGQSVISRMLKELGVNIRTKRLGIEKLTKEELYNYYHNEMMSVRNIAKKLGVESSTIVRWAKEYGIKLRDRSEAVSLAIRINSNQGFVNFLRENETARNLAASAVILNGTGSDVENIMLETYKEEFRDLKHLHKLIEQNREDIKDFVREGITNLGNYLGSYTLEDRAIIPILLGQALIGIPESRLSESLEGRIIRVLRQEYGPFFNDNPEETLSKLEKTIGQYEGKVRGIYQKLYNHYQEVMQLQQELL